MTSKQIENLEANAETILRGAEQTVPSESSGSVSQRLIEAEDILSELANGYWVSTLDDADSPVNEKMGQRILNYWKKQNGEVDPHSAGGDRK